MWGILDCFKRYLGEKYLERRGAEGKQQLLGLFLNRICPPAHIPISLTVFLSTTVLKYAFGNTQIALSDGLQLWFIKKLSKAP